MTEIEGEEWIIKFPAYEDSQNAAKWNMIMHDAQRSSSIYICTYFYLNICIEALFVRQFSINEIIEQDRKR